MPVPMLCVLDEAANVCRLTELPAWYSHLGSQGICLMTIVQNLSQAQKVWGQDGVKQLQDAANFLWYGGGIKDKTTLSDLSALVGDHDVERWSTSRSGGMFDSGSTSRSQSWSKEPIMTVDDLAAIPKTRALVQISGNRPVLMKKLYWSDGPNFFVIAYADDAALGIGGVRFVDQNVAELTKVFTAPAMRGLGVASAVLDHLEGVAVKHGCRMIRLDTRSDLVEACSLYERRGFERVEPFNDAQYANRWYQRSLND